MQTSKKIFVEDNTWNMLFASELKSILPEAKFIHLVRDPRDVIVSLIHQQWAPDNLGVATKFYNSLMKKIVDVSNSLPQNSILQIKLEDLISDPNKIRDIICEFCGMAAFSKPINKELSDSHSGRWTKELSAKEQQKIEAATTPFCTYFAYTNMI